LASGLVTTRGITSSEEPPLSIFNNQRDIPLPGAGTPYAHARLSSIRRLYLRHLACHLYYTFDDNQVIVRALWAARRGRGPGLQ